MPDAIQTDAEKQQIEVQLPRDEMMAVLEQRRTEELAKEGVKFEDHPKPEDPHAPTETTEAAPTETDVQLEKQLQDEPVVLDADDKYRLRVKIDGEESEIPLSEVARSVQKNGAADRRLNEAVRVLKEAETRAAQILKEAEIRAAQKPGESTSVKNDPADPPPVKDFVAALFSGDEEKALEAFNKVFSGRPEPKQAQPTLDETAVIAKVAPVVKQQLAVESALERFQQDYPDIVSDPYLATVADDFVKSEMESGKDIVSALKSAGDLTRGWLRQKAGVKSEEKTPTTTRAEKLEKKAGIDVVPAASVTATTQAPQPQTGSDVILEMRKQRGLPI